MSTPFFRSASALDADREGRVSWGLLLAAALITAWIAWFFLATVSLHELSTAAHLTSPSQVVAQFPAAAQARIGPGQVARLRLDDFPWTDYGMVNATVLTVTEQVRDGRIEVALTIQPDSDSAIPFQPGLTGQVEIEVSRITPVALLLNRAGQLLVGPEPAE